MTSPWVFPIGREVPADHLVGRETFIDEVVARVNLGESLVIGSPRRTGKTSVTREVLRRLQAQGWLTAFVDLLRTPSEPRLSEALVDAVLQNETGLHRTLERLRGAATSAAGRIHLSTKTAEGLEFALGFQAAAPDLEAALGAGEVLAHRLDSRIVVAFDEFQSASNIRHDIYGFMRSILQRHQRAVYLFLGSQAGLLEQQFTESHAPFFRFAIVHRLPAVPPDAWVPYLLNGYRAAGWPVSNEFCRRLAERAGGHPYSTMVMANKALMVLSLRGGVSELALLDLAYEAGLDDLQATYDEMFRALAAPAAAQDILMRLASNEPPYHGTANATVRRALRALTDAALVTRVGRGRYIFPDPLFAEYVRRLRT